MTHSVVSHLTNGFGNNIFQYVAGRLLAEHHGCYHFAQPYPGYYAVEDLKQLGVNFTPRPIISPVQITDKNYAMAYDELLSNQDLVLNGYFEDYTHYIEHIEKIKSWFPPVTPHSQKTLVIHLRTGDRLKSKNEFYMKPTAKQYLKAISNFDFDEFHIVTDMPVWRKITATEFEKMEFQTVTYGQRVTSEESVSYFNDLVEAFSRFDPIVQKRTIVEDFNFIRKSRNILFEHGTLSWWAAVLSDAEKVGVYGPWRPWKKETNKNLSQIPLDNWFRWE